MPGSAGPLPGPAGAAPEPRLAGHGEGPVVEAATGGFPLPRKGKTARHARTVSGGVSRGQGARYPRGEGPGVPAVGAPCFLHPLSDREARAFPEAAGKKPPRGAGPGFPGALRRGFR